MNVIGTALTELYRCFHILNRDKFNETLLEPVITIQKGRGNVMGYFTVDKVWVNKTDAENEMIADESDESAYYEINIDPRYFYSRNAVEIIETLLHEMVHYFNKLSGIKDCNGNVHNKQFKKVAEEVGLIVEKGKSIGYGYTSLSDELKKYILDVVNPDDSVFEYFRASAKKKEKKKRKKSLFTFTCPQCGQVAKAKKGIIIKCGVCDVNMDIEDIESDDEDNEDNDEEDKEDSENNDF